MRRKIILLICTVLVGTFVFGSSSDINAEQKAVNSKQNDWDAFIAPDESYIIFSSQNRSDTLGDQDLYISYRNKNDEWIQSINMGERVNSKSSEICPVVTLDGKYLFFTSRRRGNADIYWADAKIIEELKSKELK